mmetsp:Transcript_71830/g.187251  ORF Transcript_71830/g.187251 Transcript_71830/m.187251 type:complete len:229 (-) Transcript_71830:157-843(-)
MAFCQSFCTRRDTHTASEPRPAAWSARASATPTRPSERSLPVCTHSSANSRARRHTFSHAGGPSAHSSAVKNSEGSSPPRPPTASSADVGTSFTSPVQTASGSTAKPSPPGPRSSAGPYSTGASGWTVPPARRSATRTSCPCRNASSQAEGTRESCCGLLPAGSASWRRARARAAVASRRSPTKAATAADRASKARCSCANAALAASLCSARLAGTSGWPRLVKPLRR